LVIALLAFAIASSDGLIDPYTHGFVSATILNLGNFAQPQVAAVAENIQGAYILIAQVSLFSDINPAILEYVPIAGLVALAATVFVVVRLVRNTVAAVFVAGILSYRSFAPSIYGVWPHAFGFALFLFLVGVFARRSQRTPEKVALLWLIFMAIQLYSYTAELWAVSFVVSIQAYALIARTFGKPGKTQRQAPPFSAAIAFAMLVTFLGVNQVIYGQYLPLLLASKSALSTSASYYFSLLFRTTPPVPYAWIPHTSPASVILHSVWPVLGYGPFVLIFPAIRKWAPPSPGEERNQFGLLLGGLVFAWIADVAVYSSVGGFGAALFRVPSMAAPFLVLIPVGRLIKQTDSHDLNRARAVAAYSATLLLVTIAIFGHSVTVGNYVTSPSRYVHADNSALWLYSHAPWAMSIYSDHNTQGRYSITYATEGKWFDPNHIYTSASYSHLVNPKYAGTTDHYFQGAFVVVNLELAQQRTTAGGWLDFEPLGAHLPTIQSNVNLGLIYADGYSDIFLGMSS